jgi:outer membrane protein assembly factor BamE (lipoprotein component of BamABCDE complex)
MVCRASVVVAAMAATGCIAMHKSTINVQGEAVAKASLQAVKEGVTTREDLIKAFGQPDQTLNQEGGRETLVYVQETRETNETSVLFLLAWDTTRNVTVRHNFELTNGVLTRYWKE